MHPVTIDKLPKDHTELPFVKHWTGGNGNIPIYHAKTMHALNRIIGYARLINCNSGTVLYRGQDALYNSLLPSGARKNAQAVSETLFDQMIDDPHLLKFFSLDESDILGWRQYQIMVMESALQHYGAKTLCMDFVDNHWCALWFGAYSFSNGNYNMRDDDGNLYIILCVADTICPCIKGLYIGEDTYTIDLRKTLPSCFQRPASQHGWMVRNKERNITTLEDRIAGIVEVSVQDALRWIGSGTLLTDENFFPSFEIDQGYKVLLSRQCRSGIKSREELLLPTKVICNYHLSDLFYCSDLKKMEGLQKNEDAPDWMINISITELFDLLLSFSWTHDSCDKTEYWNERLPYTGQSGVTALLIQCLYGGDLKCYTFSRTRNHYFNVIDDVVLDLTYKELVDTAQKRDYIFELTKCAEKEFKGTNVRSKNENKVSDLISSLNPQNRFTNTMRQIP
ncbi:MAG: FRG domain-containing protein [Eggerthella sp.]|nr:FRG domain-containing protein [Eggerthella sp.]